MPVVDFKTTLWNEPWFRKIDCAAKFLFIYLDTNNHIYLSGLYPLAIETISFDTGIPLDTIEGLLETLDPEVRYDKEKQIVWVVNHVKHQFLKKSDHNISPTIVIKLTKNLRELPENHPFIKEFLEKYPYLGIEYQDTLSQYSKGKGKDTGKGEDEEKHALHPKETECSNECKSPPWDSIGSKGR